MTVDWDSLITPEIQHLLNLIKDQKTPVKIAFLGIEDFMAKSDDESLYKFMVQIRRQLTSDVVKDDEVLLRRLDAIANHGTQSKVYMDKMRKAFLYMEKENKPLPPPPPLE